MLSRRKKNARQVMVASQIRPNKVTDPSILSAFLKVSRENFLPTSLHPLSYSDAFIEIDDEAKRSLLPPWLLARLIQLISPKPNEKILVIGCATGYSLAILKELSNHVIGVEEKSDFVKALRKKGFDVIQNKLAEGMKEQAPYDVIILEGGVQEIPETLIQQLSPSGRLVTFFKPKEHGLGVATIVTHDKTQSFFDASCFVLPGFEIKKSFQF